MKRRRDINLGATGCLCWETSTYSPDCCDPDDPKAEQIGRTRGPLTPPEPPPPPPPPEPSLGYGLLYNWYAATDERGIAPDGWRVPTVADFTTLFDEYSGVNNSATRNALMGNRRIADGHPYWDGGSISEDGTNTEGWAFYALGERNSDGSYFTTASPFNATFGYWWTTSTPPPSNNPANAFLSAGQGPVIDSNFGGFDTIARNGCSIRCLRDTPPPSPTVTDADGNTYTWVQIGAQYWLAQNLKTTKYNNGDDIPTGLDNAAWAATTDGAYAFPNGDPNLPI